MEDRSLALQGFPQNPPITSTQPSELLPSCPARGWSPGRPIKTLQLGQGPILSKATIQKNWDLQEIWVTICFTRALLNLQNDSLTLYDAPPDPRRRG